MKISPAPLTLDPDNPWPGLASYSTEGAAFFHGREKETAALFRLVETSTAAVLMGASGLGKTSLLRAGLIPRLLEHGGWPVFLRPDWRVEASSLTYQILQQVAAAAANHGLEMPPITLSPKLTLWEFFHHRQADFWSRDHQLTTPVILLDQFEEAFTLGVALPERQAELKEILVSLTTHRCPEGVRRQFASGEIEEQDFDFRREGCRLLLSLREDFAASLEDWRRDIPALGTHRFRLLPLQAKTAVEVLEATGHHLLEPGAAAAITHFVSDRGTGGAEEVSPPLLNIVARELNIRRQAEGLPCISAAMLESKGQDILEDFYRRSFEGMGETARILVEDHLLTASGYRSSVAMDDALRQPDITPATIDLLIHRRLLRSDDRSGIPRLELTHDLLLPIAARSREERLQQRQLAAATAREASARREKVRLLRLAGAMGFLTVAALAAAGFAVHQWRAATAAARQATEARDAAEPLVTFLLGGQFDALEAAGRLSLMEQTAQVTEAYLKRLPTALQHTVPYIRLSLRRSQNLDTLGQLSKAITEARASAELAASLAGHPELQAESLAQLGNLLPRQAGGLAEALEVCRRSVALYLPLAAQHPKDEVILGGLAKARIHLGEALRDSGDLEGALKEFSTAQAGLPDGSHARIMELRCLVLMNTADAFTWQRRHEDAVGPLQEGLSYLKQLRAREPGNYRWMSLSVDFLLRSAENETSRDYSEKSLEYLETALAQQRPLCALDPLNVPWQTILLTLETRLAQTVFLAGESGKATAFSAEARSLLEKLWTKAGQDSVLSSIAMELGELQLDLQSPDEGLQLFNRALEARLSAAQTGEPEPLRDLLVTSARLARYHVEAGAAAAAATALETARETRRRIEPQITDSNRAAWAFDDAGLAQIEGNWLQLKNEPAAARAAYQRTLQIASGLLNSNADDAQALDIFLTASQSMLASTLPHPEAATICLNAGNRLKAARAASLNAAFQIPSATWLVNAAIHSQENIPAIMDELRAIAATIPEEARPAFWEETANISAKALPSPGAALIQAEALSNLPATADRSKKLTESLTTARALDTVPGVPSLLEEIRRRVPTSGGSSRVKGGSFGAGSNYVAPAEATAPAIRPTIMIRTPRR